VGECSHFHPISVDPDQDIESAVEVLRDAGVRRLPVVAVSGQVVGILSLDDVAGDVRRYVEAFTEAVGQYSKSASV
jgi:CBS domain-containing protein